MPPFTKKAISAKTRDRLASEDSESDDGHRLLSRSDNPKSLDAEFDAFDKEDEDEDGDYQSDFDDEDDDDSEELDPKEELRRLMEPVEGSDEGDEQDDDEGDEQDDNDLDEQDEDDMNDAKQEKDYSGKEKAEYKRDLMDSSESESEVEMTLHQKRQRNLRSEIERLESEQLAPKDWTMRGEVTARARPKDSLLEAPLEFDRAMGASAATSRTGPEITQERHEALESVILNRIRSRAFDDVLPRALPKDNKAAGGAKTCQVDFEKSTKSLAELYEDDYVRAKNQVNRKDSVMMASSSAAASPADAKLAEQQATARARFLHICQQLNAMTSGTAFIPPVSMKKYDRSLQEVSIVPLSLQQQDAITRNAQKVLTGDDVEE